MPQQTDRDSADVATETGRPETPPLEVPAPPSGFPLPDVEVVIDDEEFEERVPELSPDDDPELGRPLESLEEFERGLAQELANQPAAEGPSEADAPLGGGSQNDNEQGPTGGLPFADAELAKPLPPLEAFELEQVEFAEPEEDGDGPAEVRYLVELIGLDLADEETEANLRSSFADLSTLGLGEDTAASFSQLRARLADDAVIAERILASEGWYSASVSTRISPGSEGRQGPVTAQLTVDPGPRYTLDTITIDTGPVVPESLIRDNFPLQIGEPIVAARVQGAEARLAVALPQNGYPFAELGQRDILLDTETGEGDYTLPLALGPRARFGAFRTEGDAVFDVSHIARLSRFRPGDLYDSRDVDDLRQALVATGLFNAIAVVPAQTGEDAGDGTESATIVVTQDAGPPRTIAASAGYGTGQGFRVEGSWTHRNLFPPEGALIASALAGTQEQGASATFRRSNAGRRDLTFRIAAEVLHSNYDAYEAYTGRLSVLYSYDSTPIWQKPFTFAVGGQILATNEQDFNIGTGLLERRTFFIGGLSGQVGFDRTDDLLDPTGGFRVIALIEPEGSLEGGFNPYLRARADVSAYFSPTDSLVLAGRLRLGTIQGAERVDIAPSRRFYAGGGGSVRGFGYQQLGPQAQRANPRFDPTDPEETARPFLSQPLGGRSVVEGAIELRYRFGDYGVVGFVDAGQVYEATMPDFNDIRLGVGLGGRYYTNFGPVRFDIAIPIDRRTGESSFAVYVGIGQAF